MTTNELRKRYLEFFKKKGHTFFVSDTLLPDSRDETLLFTPAGMNQFKPYFLGEKSGVKRAVSCQKCLRTGDLEKVGQTPYHHTFFEMLGNFSFGDYFKKEAIEYAWEFLTKELKMNEKDLWVSVYKDDNEAYDIWQKHVGVVETRIVKLGQESNFWPASAPSEGPNGPCGPCSEIFFDRGRRVDCDNPNCNPDCSCSRFVEIWNLVFTQFNRVGVDKLEPLPQKNIDTGMGLERMASVLQGVESNFEIDILKPAVDFVFEKIAKKSPNTNLLNAIVDHARAATFAIADGVYPSNEGRGYVIRRIVRKALREGRLIGNKEPFLYKMPEVFAKLMGETYPEVDKKKDIISKVILAEEEKYFSVAKEGEVQARRIMDELDKVTNAIVSGEDAFRLHDTYGFSLEELKRFAKIKGYEVDEKGFNILMDEQQERSRRQSMFDDNVFKKEKFNLKVASEFVGYDSCEFTAKIIKLIENEEERDSLPQGVEGYIILDKTPFYPQSGGQLTDKGLIKTEEGEFFVDEVFKISDAVVHKGKVIKGEINKVKACASVDKERRQGLARTHTATHLLQAALREVLGEHVAQQGSLVDVNRLRFDFTHFSRVKEEELVKVENKVREFISKKIKIKTDELTLNQAKEEGALAFFKDKYQGQVRVVSVSSYSKELCGGTHVDNTNDIEDFTIISESSISSGIRRIVASVGKGAAEDRTKIARTKADKAIDKIKKNDKANIGQAVNEQAERFIFSDKGDIIGLEDIEGINFVSNVFSPDASSSCQQSRILLSLSDRIKKKLKSAFIFVVASVCEKDIFICSITDDLRKRGLSCKEFISKFSKELSLSGGGNDKTCQGSVRNRDDDFLEKVKNCFGRFID